MCYLILLSFTHNNSLKLIRIDIYVIFLHQYIAVSDSFSNVWKRLFKLLQVSAMVLSSAKLCKSDFVSHNNKLFIKMLNRVGPSIEPCRTPEHPKV